MELNIKRDAKHRHIDWMFELTAKINIDRHDRPFVQRIHRSVSRCGGYEHKIVILRPTLI